MLAARHVTITHTDGTWHEAFHAYVQRLFPGISFRAWQQHGGWDARYKAFACVEGGEIVANASAFEMDLLLNGRRVRGCSSARSARSPRTVDAVSHVRSSAA